MHLKSLTLKGFKSFASATSLKFEPGICAVVGPNGSGKSNVVDALAWVMGEGSAKTLRGGKMQDVIFAGAGDRKALGRAEVTLTIDNADGALPIEYSEVSVTRRMFRDGASEYEINGAKARLMDIQELLSDSGIGREMHIIVGQGKLSEILESRPEDRRSYIEEAAGVLKHRRRKEKAQRKLTGMQANLDRLQDLTDELGKQLKPLARQAEAAQRAATVQADLRDARLRLAGDRVVRLRSKFQEAERAAEDLVAEADAEEGQPGPQHSPQQLHRGVGGGRVTRAVGEEDAVGALAGLACHPLHGQHVLDVEARPRLGHELVRVGHDLVERRVLQVRVVIVRARLAYGVGRVADDDVELHVSCLPSASRQASSAAPRWSCWRGCRP